MSWLEWLAEVIVMFNNICCRLRRWDNRIVHHSINNWSERIWLFFVESYRNWQNLCFLVFNRHDCSGASGAFIRLIGCCTTAIIQSCLLQIVGRYLEKIFFKIFNRFKLQYRSSISCKFNSIRKRSEFQNMRTWQTN